MGDRVTASLDQLLRLVKTAQLVAVLLRVVAFLQVGAEAGLLSEALPPWLPLRGRRKDSLSIFAAFADVK